MRLLWVGDSPRLNTGFAKVTREVLSRLAKAGRDEVSCWGWHDQAVTGRPHGFPFELHSGGESHEHQRLLQTVRAIGPDVIVALGDVWHLTWLTGAPLPSHTKLLPYFPVDGAPLRINWVSALRRCEHLVTMSAFGEEVIRGALAGKRAARIELGVDPTVFRPLPDRAALRKGFVFGPKRADLRGRFVVGCVARNQPRKQFPVLIKAFGEFGRRHPEAFLYLHTAPTDSGWDLPELLWQAGLTEQAALPEGVDALTGCPEEELNRLYNLMDVFVLPTMGEGFGLPLLEAMAAGVPVVATDCTSVTELVRGRGELLKVRDWVVPPGGAMEQALPDQAHLLEVLEKLHAKPALREVHGRAGRQFAEESTWERTAERWQALLGEVAPRPSSRATRRPGEAAIEPHAERVETRGATAAERFTAAVELPPPGRQGPTMAILAPTFYDEVSGQPWMGGGERYVVDLAALLAEMGVSAHVFQPSLVPWQRQYGDLTIYGLGVTGVEYDVLPDANLLFHEVTADYDHVLYAGMALCYPTARPGSVAISHGIWWDTAADNWWRTPEWRRRIFRCLENAAMVVSVDTNTINWVRAERPDLAGKFRYLPNAVDLTQFRPSSRTQSQAPLVVLFPRRLVAGRGFEIMLEMASEVLRTNGEVQFRFVGRGTPEAEVHMRELCRREPRVRWEWRRLEDMPEVYQQADITVIPSLFSEGTSLSCLEAMASGNAVLATHVGGLGNLILDGYNGLLVEPSREAILAGLARLLEDWDLRQRLGAHARASAEAFSKERWREQWRSLLNEVYLTGAGRSTEPDRRVRLRAPVVAVVSLGHWGMTGGGQRPQKLAEAWLRRGVSVLHIQQDEPVMSALPDGVGVIGCPELWPGGLLGRPPSDFEGFWRRVDGLCSVRPSVAVLSACSPAMVALAAEFKRHGVPVIYDVLDDWREFSRLRGPKWYKAHSERELVRLADRVTAVSPALVERLGPDHVTLVPNAVDWRLVSSPRSSRRPADLPAKGQLTVGYIGSLGGEWHDWSAAEAIARARPQWALVLIGPGGEMVPTSLTGLPNVRVLEPRPHAEIAECIDHFDVTLVPFRQNALCNAVSPIKAYDYLARGCPVVSSPMSGVQGLPRLKVVHQTEDWVPLIEEAARLPRERPLDWLWENTWDQRVTEFAIGGLLTRRKEPEGGAVEERLGRLVPYPERTRACVEWRMAADCNYECPYCRFDRGAERAAGQWGLKQIQAAWDRFSSDHGPCHVRACGLEPMLGKRNLRILAWLSRDNSLDISTNLAFALPALKPFRRPENVFFSAGFHPVAGVSAGDFVAKVRAVEAEGFTVSEVSMVAYPPYLKRIGDWHREFEQAGIDLQVRPCVGPYEGRQLPQGYTPAEREALARHLAPERLRRLNSPHSSRGRLCATGWRYMVVRADGTVARCPQGEGDWGGFQFYRDRVRLRDHPTVCSFGDCFQEDLQAYCFSEAERLAYLGATK